MFKDEENKNSNDQNFNLKNLPDDLLGKIFTFFKPSEQNELRLVSKRWYEILTKKKFTVMETYASMKIMSDEKRRQASDYFWSANLRIENAREIFQKKLENLPYWFGNKNSAQAEQILKGGYPVRSLLLRTSRVQGCIALSLSVTKEDNDKLSFNNNIRNLKPVGAILLPAQKEYQSAPNTNTPPKEELKIVHCCFIIFEDNNKIFKLRINGDTTNTSYTLDELDFLLRTYIGTPISRVENSNYSPPAPK